MSNFVHLRTHSSSSIKDGLIDPKDLPKLAAGDGQKTIALTDLNLMLGTVDFYEASRSAGVKPIIGVDAWIESDVTAPALETGDESRSPEYHRVVLLVQNHDGYLRLMRWLSRAYLDNQKKGLSAIKQSWMRDEDNDGLIVLSGDMQTGEVAQAVLLDDPAQARQRAMGAIQFYRETFGDRYYLEVQRYNQPNEALQVDRLVKLARSTRIPLVATHPVQFATPEEFFTHEMRYCVSNGEVINDAGRAPVFSPEQSFQSRAQMEALFADLPEALDNSASVAERCTVTLTLGKNFLPHFDTGDSSSAADSMIKRAREGLVKRMEGFFPDPVEREKERPAYEERLEHELKTIVGMDFPGYFLIVSDFIGWARTNDISVGPGRGSGAGSLVAYSLGITDINPLPYGLLFERFLNPERVSMPDFDVDFEAAHRDEVIAYVRRTYGENSVCQISTTGKLAARAALQGAAGALGVSPQAKLTLSKLIPEKPVDRKLSEALYGSVKKDLEPIKELRDRYEKEVEIRKIIDLALKLEKLPVSLSKHASGVLISPSDITDFSPLYYDPSSKTAVPVSQYDGHAVELAGLVKFDFLGLNNLDILKATIRNVEARPDFAKTGAKFNLDNIPLDDAKTFELFARGETIGVFQFESHGMQRLLKNARPDRFDDLIALVSLFRPGPMDLIPSFIARKHGLEEVTYPDPRVEAVLKETYGVMVYQEQVMRVAQVIGGYSLGGADLLRRAMGKKKVEEMVKERLKFQAGAVKNGLTEEKGAAIFDDMEKFAGYGFNKSHAAAYAVLAYRSAYLKANYPVEYYTALINNYASDSTKHKKLPDTIANAHAVGIRILPPDINTPDNHFVSTIEGIRYGMSGLKGVNEKAVEAVIDARREGPFLDLLDFCRRTAGTPHVNKRVIDALVKVGAFDSIEPNRAMLLANVDTVNKYGSKFAKRQAKDSAAVLAADMFADLPPVAGASPVAAKRTARKAAAPKELDVPEMVPQAPWSIIERVRAEFEVAGFYLSGHPFDAMAESYAGLHAATPLHQFEALDPDKESGLRLLTGVVDSVYVAPQSNGGNYGRITLSDGEGTQSIMAFADAFGPHEEWVVPGAHFAAAVRLEYDNRPGETGISIKVDHILPPDQLQALLLDKVHVAIQPSQMADLERVLDTHKAGAAAAPGPSVTVRLHLPDSENPGHFLTGDLARKPVSSPQLLADLESTFGSSCVKTSFHRQVTLKEAPRPGRKNNRSTRPR